ncbi:MAG: PD-(D/E)XK nuclease family protein [Candidatus Lernaella stagnicola]|nr:PD-(D/E)XK nuclease family protein [Candidatus Lernaella stagnicola]
MQVAAAGTFAACVDAFVETVTCRRDPLRAVVALVGSHLLRDQIRRRLHEQAGGALNVELITFRDLADRLGRPALSATGRREAGPLYSESLIARLLLEDRRGYFHPVAHFAGTAAALAATFTDLEEAGWTRFPGSPRGAKQKSVAKLFTAYRDELGRRFFTAADALAAAVTRVDRFPRLFGADDLHVVGIYDANPLQQRLLNALGEIVDVRFYLPDVLDPPAMAQAAGGRSASPATPPVETLRILSCPSEIAEVKAIVRRMRRLRREGVPYHDMAVLLRHPDVYADLFFTTLERAGVPSCAPGLCGTVDHPTVRALLALLKLPGSPWGRAAIVGFLSSTVLPDAAAAWRETQTRWPHVSRVARVRRGDDWQTRFTNEPRKLVEDDHDAFHHLGEAAGMLCRGLQAITNANNYAEAVAIFSETAGRFIASDDVLERARDALSKLAVMDAAGLPFELSRFQSKAVAAVSAAAPPPHDKTGVCLTDWITARGSRFACVFVPGCVEQMVPHKKRQDAILLDAERIAISEAAGAPGALPVTAELAREELRLFDIVLRAATDKVCLSVPRLDAGEGRTRLPSHLVLELAGRLSGRALTFGELGGQPFVENIPASRFGPGDPQDAFDEEERRLAVMEALDDPLQRVHYLLATRSEFFERLWERQMERFTAFDSVTPSEGLVTREDVRAALAAWADAKKHWSVSEVESYALCPRRFLFERVLRLESPDDPEAVVALPPDRAGTLLHKLMESLEERLDPAFRDEAQGLLDKLYREVVAENLTGGGVLDEAEHERLLTSMKAMLQLARDQAGRYSYKAVEEQVDLVLKLPDGAPLRLKGRLDRLDERDDGVERIVDFKTGRPSGKIRSKKLAPDNLNAGATLQVPLYAAARATTREADVDCEAAYWFLKNAKGEIQPEVVSFSAEQLVKWRDVLPRILVQLIADVRAGKFVPRPDVAAKADNGYCGYCPYTVICDPRARALLAAKPPLQELYAWLDEVGRADE